MKTILKPALMVGIAMSANITLAQIPLTVKTFDEESLLKGRAWRMVDAGMDPANGQPYITYGQPSCEMSSKGSSYKYYGVAWNFNRFYFSKELDYTHTDEKTFPSTIEALEYAPIWGKVFQPMNADMNVGAGAAGIAVSMAKGGLSLGPVTKDYLGKKTVLFGMKGFTQIIGTAEVYSQVVTGAGMSSKPTAQQLNSCWETPTYKMLGNEPIKEEKGQKWYPQFSSSFPGGGFGYFATVGVVDIPNKANYIFRKYDENAAISKQIVISYDNQVITKMMELESDQTKKDFVILVLPLNYKDKSLPMAEPLSAEYLRIDSESLEVKERFSFQLLNSQWMLEKAIEKDGAVYLMGPSTNATKDRMEAVMYRSPSKFTNYQIAKIAHGKLDYINSITATDISANVKVMPGVKGKVAPNMILVPNGALKYWIRNGEIFITGQQYEGDKYGNVTDFGALILVHINKMGKVEAFYGKPESQISRGDIFFKNETSTVYWSTYDYKPLNDITGAQVLAKKFGFIASVLHLTKLDLAAKTIAPLQVCGAQEYAPVNGSEVLFESDTHIAFNARSLAKKAKNSDVTLVMFEK